MPVFEDMPIENPLHGWPLAYPLLESIHLMGIVLALGTAASMNLRLLGVRFASAPAQLWRETWLLNSIGLAVAIGSGLLIFSIAPEEYAKHPAFSFKMGALTAAIAFYFTMVRRAAGRDAQASLVAAISLTLYSLVPLGGILLGYD